MTLVWGESPEGDPMDPCGSLPDGLYGRLHRRVKKDGLDSRGQQGLVSQIGVNTGARTLGWTLPTT